MVTSVPLFWTRSTRSYLLMARFRASSIASAAVLLLPDVCAAASAANTPQLATNALGGPNSTTSPPSNTSTRSNPKMVWRWCAMASRVCCPAPLSASATSTSRSECESRAEVASSISSNAVWRSSARATQSSWHWPRLREIESVLVSRASGNARTVPLSSRRSSHPQRASS